MPAFPSFPCDQVAQLENVESYLSEQLEQHRLYPICRISGRLLDGLVERVGLVPEESFGHLGGFSKAEYDTSHPDDQALIDMMLRLTTVGIKNAGRATSPSARILRTHASGLHVDDNFGNIINLTTGGERQTMHVDCDSNVKEIYMLTRGVLSVIPSIAIGQQLETVPHQVVSGKGTILQVVQNVGFRRNSIRENIPA